MPIEKEIKRSEIGYLHEILDFSIKNTKKIKKEKYIKGVKFLSFLLEYVISGERKEIRFKEPKNNNYLKFLYSLIENKNIERNKNSFVSELDQLIEQNNIISINEMSDINFIINIIFSHILLKEIKNKKLLSSRNIDDLINKLDNNEIKSLLKCIKWIYYNEVPNDTEISEAINSLVSIENIQFLILASYLSYNLALKFNSYKKDMFIVHYLSLKKLSKKFQIPVGDVKLDDSFLEELFRFSLVLYFCGYKKTLRISEEEKNNYLEKVITVPTLSSTFERVYNERASIEIFHLKIPILFLLIISFIFIVVAQFYEFHTPTSFGLEPFEFQLPFSLPVFGLISIIIMFIVIIYIYKLKKNISMSLRRGN